MSNNNYSNSHDFSQPPPNYNPKNNSWSYNWKPEGRAFKKEKQDKAVSSYKGEATKYQSSYQYAGNSQISSPTPSASPAPSDQRNSNYYGTGTQLNSYLSRRYSNNSQGHYSASPGFYTLHQSAQYGPPPPPPPPPPASQTPPKYNSNNSYPYMNANQQQGYQRNYYNKRKNSDLDNDGSKRHKKTHKKKPLSQNVPQKKEWTLEEAGRALEVEKKCNKRLKSQSLIIKFPDLELNRDIVSMFHPTIDSVHFQQPSTPRYCFVTLQESADSELVIKELNKIPFGDGYLVAEYKKDREDDMNIGPEDIDPLTLYVGNLAQEVTKDDMVSAYPKQKRIDIGYAKKMKYTRYASVSFNKIEDSIEAFLETHATQMRSKSLIVRFWRLHGAAGMPGEPKPQPLVRKDSPNSAAIEEEDRTPRRNNRLEQSSDGSEADTVPTPWESVDTTTWNRFGNGIDFSVIKKELPEGKDSEKSSDDDDVKPPPKRLDIPFMPGSLELAYSTHKPMEGVKKETADEVNFDSLATMLKEKRQETASLSKNAEDAVAEDAVAVETVVKVENVAQGENDYNSLRLLLNSSENLIRQPVEIKKEVIELPEGESPPVDDTIVEIKTEPIDKDDINNDKSHLSGEEEGEDFNFGNILSNLGQKKKPL